jgi:hypothetical protein
LLSVFGHSLAAKNAFEKPAGVLARSLPQLLDMRAIVPCVLPLGARIVGGGLTIFVANGLAAVPQMYVCLCHGSPNSKGWNDHAG